MGKESARRGMPGCPQQQRRGLFRLAGAGQLRCHPGRLPGTDRLREKLQGLQGGREPGLLFEKSGVQVKGSLLVGLLQQPEAQGGEGAGGLSGFPLQASQIGASHRVFG
jgi:hypothetical protein